MKMRKGALTDLSKVEVRAALSHAELLEVMHIQKETWGDDDVVPVTQLRAVAHAGGQLAAAFLAGRMVGFAYGFVAFPHGRGMSGTGLHSHMVAVRKEAQGLGIGRLLKHHQREWALAKGLRWISWTFDPLQAGNARLNLEHLGAVAFDYLKDFYGVMEGPLGGGQSSDRLVAVWQLASELGAARQLVDGNVATQEPPGDADGFWTVKPCSAALDAKPHSVAWPVGAPLLRVAIPTDTTWLLHERPELARLWRRIVGDVMSEALASGYVATGFRGGAYILTRHEQL